MRLDYLILGVIMTLVVVALIGLETTLSPFSARKALDRQRAQAEERAQTAGSRRKADAVDPIGTPAPAAKDSAGTHAPLARFQAPPLENGLSSIDDYSDPAAGGVVPLTNVQGREDEFLSPHFRVSDVSARDGAPYARISPRLVNTLELLTRMTEAPIFISSGYRHPALNADPAIGGAPRSQHMAGQAADIWSSEMTPGELAEWTLSLTECAVGIGLGRTFLHIDLRGHLASWVYEDAAMDEATFDHWTRTRCADRPGAEPLSFADAAKRAAQQSEMRAAVLEDSLIGGYRDVLATYAHARLRARGRGAVILDLRPRDAGRPIPLPDRLSYVLPGSEAARHWNLDALIRSTDTDSYFVFAIIDPAGEVTMGAMSFELALSDR